jgi:hypothetical protein
MRAPRPPIALDEDVLVIGPDRSLDRGATAAGAPFRPGSFRRIAGASALFLSLLIALLSLLEQDRASAGIFTLIALACLALTLYPARPRVA